MADSTVEFFDELGQRGHEPLLEKTSGSIRIDLRNGKTTDRWLITISKGDLDVSREGAAADCVVSTDRAVFDKIASGRTNAVAAMLRGAITVEGDIPLLVSFQRLLPGPPRARRRRSPTTARSRA
jgi:putative sterol carrier protein